MMSQMADGELTALERVCVSVCVCILFCFLSAVVSHSSDKRGLKPSV